MDSSTLEEILVYLCSELGGDWFLTGGSLVRLSFDGERGTEDVDLVRINHPTLSDEAARNTLFKWLIGRGLGPEWVNDAVQPFLQEVENWQSELVLLRTGSVGRIFRPTLTLFAYLKLRRGTETDVLDITKAIPKCPEGFDEVKFMSWADPVVKSKFAKTRKRLML